MDDQSLPAELEAIERELAARLPGGPADELRGRVLGGVRAELRRQQRQAAWSYAAALVAIVIVWINLSMSATRATDYHLRSGVEHESVAAAAGQIRRLVPDMSRRESLRRAPLLQAASDLPWYPDFPACSATQGRRSASDNLLP